jgi:hypothetical protein
MVAAGTVRSAIQDLFEGLVPAEGIEAYDRLLASDGCAKDQAEALVGDVGLVEALTETGMAHIQPYTPVDPVWLRPASPDLGHRRLADAQSQFGIGVNGQFPAHLVAVVSDRAQIAELSAALVRCPLRCQGRRPRCCLRRPHRIARRGAPQPRRRSRSRASAHRPARCECGKPAPTHRGIAAPRGRVLRGHR